MISSLPSPQSFWPLQAKCRGIHFSELHSNSCSEQLAKHNRDLLIKYCLPCVIIKRYRQSERQKNLCKNTGTTPARSKFPRISCLLYIYHHVSVTWYPKALSSILEEHHSTTDLSDIHLLVKRRLAGLKLGADGARQGAEERSSLLSKLLFSKYNGNHQGKLKEDPTEKQRQICEPGLEMLHGSLL